MIKSNITYNIEPKFTGWEGQTEEYRNLSSLFKSAKVEDNLKKLIVVSKNV